MRSFVRMLLLATLCGAPALEAMAQSMGPLTTTPWAARSRPKPNPSEQQGVDPLAQQSPQPPPAKPVEAAPEPPKTKAADR